MSNKKLMTAIKEGYFAMVAMWSNKYEYFELFQLRMISSKHCRVNAKFPIILQIL
jgi:hypothetical protein